MECFYYLRSLGGNPRKDVANFEKDYPELADDLHLPPIVPPERIFSSVFRVSSAKLSLWTHYDVSICNKLFNYILFEAWELGPEDDVKNEYKNLSFISFIIR